MQRNQLSGQDLCNYRVYLHEEESEGVTYRAPPQGKDQVGIELPFEAHALRCLVHLAVTHVHNGSTEHVGELFTLHEITGARLPLFIHGQINGPVLVRYR